MYENIEIVFFDINNFEEEENEEEENEEKKEEKKDDIKIEKSDEKKNEKSFPLKVIEYFLENHILIDNEKEEFEDYDLYSFIYQIEKSEARQCKFYLFSKITQESFTIDSNGLFIFCELQNEKAREILEKVIEKIKRICPQDIIIYILGIIKSDKECFLNKENIIKIFSEEEINIKYNEIDINDNKINNDNNLKNENDIKNDNNIINNNNINNEKDFNNDNNNIIINCINSENKDNINNENDNDNNIIIINSISEENDICIKDNNINNHNIIINENNLNNNNINKVKLENNKRNNIENGGKFCKKEDNQNKNEELNKKEENIFIKINKLIENAILDIYKYERKPKIKKLEYNREMEKFNSCLVY